MPRATKAALASLNVVLLPTAATRKVSNLRFKEQRMAARASRDAAPWPGEHKWPGQREREAEERILAEAGRSPELLIVMTMFEMMGADRQQELAMKVAGYAGQIRDDTSAAAAIITKRLASAGQRAAELARCNAERGE